MSKISQYLNEHILGEAICDDANREYFSHDGSILQLKPEIIINPRTTNDIRKVARFTWQLAEKGHIMPITTRGGGTDQTGSAIGSGIIINTMAHLKDIIYINLKDKNQFVHTQSGANFGAINQALQSHGLIIPAFPTSASYSTIGGAVANNAQGQSTQVGQYVSRLEVVLANGDLIETGRINRHELDKKKGLQTLEGEIYRKIDGLIEDNEQLIHDKIAIRPNDNTGYSGIAKVKERDKSFDLTPLFIGSQGTLGIISELVLKTDYYNGDESIIVATFSDANSAFKAVDQLTDQQPSRLNLLNKALFDNAKKHGKKYLIDNDSSFSQVLFISFNDFNAKQQKHKFKNALKKLSKVTDKIYTSEEHPVADLLAINEVGSISVHSIAKDSTMPPLIDGASVPTDRLQDAHNAIYELAAKHHIELPLIINCLNGTIDARTPLQLHTIADKQKTFKLIADYMALIAEFKGSMVAKSGEGRLKSPACFGQLDEEVIKLYEDIRAAFDPFGTLNPEVKQQIGLKTLVAELDPSYNIAKFTKDGPLY